MSQEEKKCEHRKFIRTDVTKCDFFCTDCGIEISKTPHAHLGTPQAVEAAEIINTNHPMKEKQKEVIERFKKKFGQRNHWNESGEGWDNASYYRSAGCNDCEKCQDLREEHLEFLLSEISLSNTKLMKEVLDILHYDCNADIIEARKKVKKLASDKGITIN